MGLGQHVAELSGEVSGVSLDLVPFRPDSR
jgi:hypothetical protein